MNRPLLDSREEATSSRAYDYHVALSWNGGGTEQPCVDHLYAALVRSGLRTFKDDDILCRERISEFYIQEVRKKSMISIIVLSKDFISSITLLKEVKMIINCSRRSEYLVVPVFYDLDPSEFIDQTGGSVAAFAEQQIKGERDRSTKGVRGFKIRRPSLRLGGESGVLLKEEKDKFDIQLKEDKLLKGMAVLQEASNLMGFILPNEPDSHGSIMIQRFVDFIQDGLKGNKISFWGDKVCKLWDSGISKLPENMNFPVLSMLFLQDNNDLLEIPPSFFQFMPALQVLDMSRTSIKYLPPSIANLVELRILLLRDCKLLMEFPPEIRELKNLVVFDLSGTELIYMPKEIEMLHKLECLRMSLCACADEYVSEMKEITEIIPTKTLSKLSNLKELCIFVDPDGEWWDTVVESIIQDLVSLEKMETVKLYFPTVEILQKFLQLPKGVKCQSLSDFRLIVGRYDQGIISHLPHGLQDGFETLEKCLKYVNGVGNINEVAHALKHASALFLDRHWTIDRLSILKFEMDNLRFCLLVECNEMKTVIDRFDFNPEDDKGDKSIIEKPVLGFLQYLSIHYMKNLESICVGPLASGSLSHLQILAFHTCPKLNTIFKVGLLRNLLNLKELIVEDCPEVESLVSVESSYLESGEEFLPSLEKISLLHLPGLVSISSGLRVAPRLLRMVVYNCLKLQSLSPMEMSWKDIKGIKGEIEWWETLKWKSNQPDYLRSVFTPFSRDGLMNQLAEARTSHDTLNTIQKSAENRKDVLKLEVHDNKEKQKAMKFVSSLQGVELIVIDMKEKKLTVIGDDDPICVVIKLRKFHAQQLTVEPAKEYESILSICKKVVLKLEVHDNKEKQKAMKFVSSLQGVESVAIDMKEKKLTVTGDVDPVCVVSELRKSFNADLLTIEPAKKNDPTKITVTGKR